MNKIAYTKFLQKVIKRTCWRFTNLSFRQFFLEFVLRRFKTICLDEAPHYQFTPLDESLLEQISLAEPFEFFVMIKPSGLPHEARIKSYIEEYELEISREEAYHNFPELAFHIFGIDKIHDYRYSLPEGFIWLKLLEVFYPECCRQSKILYIRHTTETRLKQLKTFLRKKIGVEFYQVQIGDINMVTCMTPIHTSDEDCLERECKILQYFKSQQ